MTNLEIKKLKKEEERLQEKIWELQKRMEMITIILEDVEDAKEFGYATFEEYLEHQKQRNSDAPWNEGYYEEYEELLKWAREH